MVVKRGKIRRLMGVIGGILRFHNRKTKNYTKRDVRLVG